MFKINLLKMKKLVLVLVVLGIFLTLSAKSVQAETSITPTKVKVIQSCEKIFPDLEKIGVQKFRQRYQYFENFWNCTILFNNPIWYSDDPNRIEKLSQLLDNPKAALKSQSSKAVIPDWIKADAKRWQEGKDDVTILLQGIKYLANNNMVQNSLAVNVNSCESATCKGDDKFVTYSIKNSNDQDVLTLTHTFHDESNNSLTVITDQVTKTGKTINAMNLNKAILVNSATMQCCDYHDFIRKSISSESKIPKNLIVQVTSEVVYPFKDQKRDALVAKDPTGSYYETIDKQTGIIIFAKYQDRIKKSEWKAELLGTNMFVNETKLQDSKTIPDWFTRVAQWWAEGKITDSDYVSSIIYLMKLNVLRV